MSLSARLAREIRQEMIAEKQVDKRLEAIHLTGKSFDNNTTRQVAVELTLEQEYNFRRSCFIFGDTYMDQPIAETHQTLESEGFKLYSANLDQNGALYIHGSLGITARVSNDNGFLSSILLICDMLVDMDLATQQAMHGLDASGVLSNGRFDCTVDATTGLSSKMHVLRYFATDGSLV